MAQIVERGRALAPGAGVALVLALAATFLSEHYAAPVMLFALLLGLSFNFLADNDKTRAGVEFSAKVLLRIGVSLLGLRIGIDQIAALGWQPVVMVVLVVGGVIGGSIPMSGVFAFAGISIIGAMGPVVRSVSVPPKPSRP